LGFQQPETIPSTRVFFLGANDKVSSILDRLIWTDSQRVVLVIPPDAKVFSQRLDLLRVVRFAAQEKMGIALVTIDPQQRSVARELRIPVFSSVERAEGSHWRRRSWSALDSFVAERRVRRPHLSELRPSDSLLSGYILLGLTAGVVLVLIYDLLTISQLDWRLFARDLPYGIVGGAAAGLLIFAMNWLVKRYAPRLFRFVRWGFMTTVFLGGILAPIAASYIIVPGARLTLTPIKTPLKVIARITVVVPPPGQQGGLEEIDFEGQRIAGRRVSAEVGGEAIAAATGTADVPSSRASGTVVFSNLLAQDYTIGNGTVVRTSAGTTVRYMITGDVTVPPLGQAAVGIEAVEPGPQGNVGVGLINRVEGAAARAVRVTNPEPTRGGGVSQVRSVTQEDRDALRRSVLAELPAQGYQRVLERPESEGGLQEGEYLVPGSVRIFQVLHETFDRFATEEAESVKIEMRVLVTGVVVDLGDAYNLARHVLVQRVPTGSELLNVEYRPGLMGDNVIGDGTLTFFVEAEGVAEARLQHDQVKRWLRGKTLEEGVALLQTAQQRQELPIIDLPEIEAWPSWAADRFPWLIWRIQVVEREAVEG
jgi:hypothetical protein